MLIETLLTLTKLDVLGDILDAFDKNLLVDRVGEPGVD